MSRPHAFERDPMAPERCAVCGEEEHHLSHVDPSRPPAGGFTAPASLGRLERFPEAEPVNPTMTTAADMEAHLRPVVAERDRLARQLVTAGEQAHLVAEERDRYRQALVTIADSQSGIWGQIAHEALHPRASGPDGP